jgi:tRNA(fMet)-specific endonuclease VapC
MNFLLDTNICSTHFRRPTLLAHKFEQYSGRLFLPTVALGELYTWAYSRDDPSELLSLISEEFIKTTTILPYDEEAALVFGKTRGLFLRQGIKFSLMDLEIASIAIAHDLALVTHNVMDFQNIPNLRIEDWLAP